MKTTNRLNILAVAAAAVLAASAALAAPLQVRSLGTKSQTTEMCPNCKDKVTCAKAGDYTIGFHPELETPKTGGAKIGVHVKDKAGKPVDDAKVVVKLSMPKHEHDIAPLDLKSAGKGWYETKTQLQMPGGRKADVEVTPKSGDTVKQSFSFSK